MRRDVCHYYEKGLREVFDAYYLAATQRFGKDCKTEPLHTLTFGLSYSMKYNMSGGACIVHFMPYKSGTAVNIRYTIVQVAGARYKAHDKDLSDYVVGVLKTPVEDCDLAMEVFLLPENQKTMADTSGAAPAAEPTSVPKTNPDPAPEATKVIPRFCWRCGAHLDGEYTFCPKCGGALKAGSTTPEVALEEPESAEPEVESIPEPEPVVEEIAFEPEPEPVVEEIAFEPEPEPVVEEIAPEPEAMPEPIPTVLNFCRHCGARLGGEYAFCPKCGGVLKAPEVLHEEPVAEPEPEPVVEEVAPEPEIVVESEPVVEATPELEVKAEPTPSPAPKFCRHCGAPLDKDTPFCPQCGGKLR